MGKLWIDLINEMGDYIMAICLPHEGASNVDYASFLSLIAAYELIETKCQKFIPMPWSISIVPDGIPNAS